MQNIIELSRQLNWIDILVFIIFLRFIFISLKQGLGVESFKLLGTVCGLYLSLHYYLSLATYLNGRSGGKNPLGSLLELLAYALLFVVGYLFFWALRFFTFRFISAQINPEVSRWGGLLLGLIRSLLLSSLVLFSFMIPKESYFRDSVRYSFSGNYVSQVAPATYTFIWESIVSKFNSGEKYNGAVRDVYSAEAKQKKKNK
jgi:uncharacterized membrane protein required for colicin V production